MTAPSPAFAADSPATLHAQPKFERVRMVCAGIETECSTKTAIFELKRTGRTLADVLVVDLVGYSSEGPRSRQCQAIVDALLSSSLPDPAVASSVQR